MLPFPRGVPLFLGLRTLGVVSCPTIDAKAEILIANQLTCENAKAACQTAFHPVQKKGDVGDYICLRADIGPLHAQGAEKLVWIPERPTQSVEDGLRGSKASVEAIPEGQKEDGATEILNRKDRSFLPTRLR